MTRKGALRYLASFYDAEQSRHGTIPFYNLERIEKLVRLFDDPHTKYKTIHVTGTKGKGSVSAMIASVLQAAGYRVGLYTSPHVLDIRERIRVNAGMISPKDLARRVSEFKDKVRKVRGIHPSFFEVYTCLAFNYFAEKKIDLAVMEVGMGGRLDATNVVKPLVSCITPISFDHTEVLGKSLSDIAREKAGIIKPGSVCVSAAQEKEALDVIRKKCRDMKTPLYIVGRDIIYAGRSWSGRGEVLDVKGPVRSYKNVRLPLAGEHQLANCALAIGVIDALIGKGYHIPKTAVARGIHSLGAYGHTPLHARCEVVRRNPLVIVDAAHNTASMEALGRTLARNFKVKKAVVIAGFLKGKDIKGMAREIEKFAGTVILTRPDNVRAMGPEEAGAYFKLAEIALAKNAREAYNKSLMIAGKSRAIDVTGSFYLAGEMIRYAK